MKRLLCILSFNLLQLICLTFLYFSLNFDLCYPIIPQQDEISFVKYFKHLKHFTIYSINMLFSSVHLHLHRVPSLKSTHFTKVTTHFLEQMQYLNVDIFSSFCFIVFQSKKRNTKRHTIAVFTTGMAASWQLFLKCIFLTKKFLL